MIKISAEAMRELLDRVKDGYEVHMRFTEEETEIEVMPCGADRLCAGHRDCGADGGE